MNVTVGIVVDEPWIGLLLDGSKTWEMRSKGWSHRGWFGLVKKGTGAVYGVARLVGVGAPLSPDQMVATFEKHRIPERMIRSGQVAKWNVPWMLSDVRRLGRPVPYRHRSGATIQVAFDADVSAEIMRQFSAPSSVGSGPAVAAVAVPEAETPPEQLQTAARSVAPVATTSLNPTRMIGTVAITEGNINHSHIYLRSFFHRFPEDAVGGSNKSEAAPRFLTIDWGGAAPVRTDLDGSKQFFRARGWIRQFFADNEAEAGDIVAVEEVAPYRYRVHLRRGQV